MAVLQDMREPGTWVEFIFISRIPGEDEGCRLQFKFCKAGQLVYDLEFGWTNITIRNYIKVTSRFPVEPLHSMPSKGLFMSFEKHLYQLDWEETGSEGCYRLRFFGSDQDFTLAVHEESVRSFGMAFSKEWEHAPSTVL